MQYLNERNSIGTERFMNEYQNEIELIDYLNVIWKRKWLIIIPTLFLSIVLGIYSFFLPPKWEIDSLIIPSKFMTQTEQGEFKEVIVVDPKQVASQINEKIYDHLIAAELKIDIKKFPKIKADNIRDTKLVRISIVENDVEKAKLILSSLFNHLKQDLDKKVEVEIKGIDTQIASKDNLIKQNENEIKKKNDDIQLKDLDIKSKEIEKDRIKKEISSLQNKLKISEDRVKSIMDEMKSVKKRIDDLDEQQKKALTEKIEAIDAISLLLYSNQVQENLRYYNTLDEKLSIEKITQENLNLDIRNKEEQLRQIDNQIQQVKTQEDTIKAEIDNIKNIINTLKTEIKLLDDKKTRIDYTQLIKEPTSSLYPVSPKKKVNVLITGILALMVFTMLAFFLEYIEKQKDKNKS